MVDVRIEAIAIVRKFNQLKFNDDELESEIKSLCERVRQEAISNVQAMLHGSGAIDSPGSGSVQKENLPDGVGLRDSQHK